MSLNDDGDVLAKMGTDAGKWADEFIKLHGDKLALRCAACGGAMSPAGSLVVCGTCGNNTRATDLDDLLRGWFANAIEAGRSAGYGEGVEAGKESGPHG